MSLFFNYRTKTIVSSQDSSFRFFPSRYVLAVCRSEENSLFLFTSLSLYILSQSGHVAELRNRKEDQQGTFYHARSKASAAVLNDELYLIGGKDHEQKSSYCQKSSLNDMHWKPCRSLNLPRAEAQCCVCAGKIFILGGDSERDWQTSIEKYENQLWIILSIQLPCPLSSFAAVPVSSKRLFLFGGRNLKSKSYNSTAIEIELDSDSVEIFPDFQTNYEVESGNCVVEGEKIVFLTNSGEFKELGVKQSGWKEKRGLVQMWNAFRMDLC
jgi:hypothetical protein